MTDILDFTVQRTILVVDDAPDNLALMSNLLKEQYRVKVAPNGPRALQIAGTGDPPDLILLDIMMPGMDGYEVCRQLKADPATARIPVVFLTAMTAEEDEARGFEVGGADYITKPIRPLTTLARVRTHLENKVASDFVRDQNAFLEREVQRRSRELASLQDATVMALAMLAENRYSSSGHHILRRQHYMRALATRLQADPAHAAVLTPQVVEMLTKTSALHNIGLVGIPDRIRLAPGPLTPQQAEIYRTHTRIARDVLGRAAAAVGLPAAFLDTARDLAYGHHEQWDGSGYPEGLAGESIPLGARLMAVINTFDELVFPDVYSAPVTPDEAIALVEGGSGTRFDPAVVRALVDVREDFTAIARRYPDSPEDLERRILDIEQAIAESP